MKYFFLFYFTLFAFNSQSQTYNGRKLPAGDQLPHQLYPIFIGTMRSSGYLSGSEKGYSEDMMKDDDPSTWWVPNPYRDGKNAWIWIRFQEPTQVRGFQIWAGSHHPDDPDYYYFNNRVKSGTCSFSDGKTIQFQLSDFDGWQYIKFDNDIKTQTLKIKITDVYEGTKWNDLCISEFVPLTTDIEHSTYGGGMEKPVIYLYPTQKINVHVQLNMSKACGQMNLSFPEYGLNGWDVIAEPDGTLTEITTRKKYQYLFWEGTSYKPWEFTDGFVVSRSETVKFLEEKLSYMGLVSKEYNDFIVYWLPALLKNEYNLIHFANDEYNALFPISVKPTPQNLLRVYMIFKPVKAGYAIKEQQLKSHARDGFTVVEWGGTQIK